MCSSLSAATCLDTWYTLDTILPLLYLLLTFVKEFGAWFWPRTSMKHGKHHKTVQELWRGLTVHQMWDGEWTSAWTCLVYLVAIATSNAPLDCLHGLNKIISFLGSVNSQFWTGKLSVPFSLLLHIIIKHFSTTLKHLVLPQKKERERQPQPRLSWRQRQLCNSNKVL